MWDLEIINWKGQFNIFGLMAFKVKIDGGELQFYSPLKHKTRFITKYSMPTLIFRLFQQSCFKSKSRRHQDKIKDAADLV